MYTSPEISERTTWREQDRVVHGVLKELVDREYGEDFYATASPGEEISLSKRLLTPLGLVRVSIDASCWVYADEYNPEVEPERQCNLYCYMDMIMDPEVAEMILQQAREYVSGDDGDEDEVDESGWTVRMVERYMIEVHKETMSVKRSFDVLDEDEDEVYGTEWSEVMGTDTELARLMSELQDQLEKEISHSDLQRLEFIGSLLLGKLH